MDKAKMTFLKPYWYYVKSQDKWRLIYYDEYGVEHITLYFLN